MPRLSRKERALSRPSPSSTRTSCAPELWPTAPASSGISALHGGQYVAQKLITTGLPAYCARLTLAPSVEVSVKAGALPPADAKDFSGPAIATSASSTPAAPPPPPPSPTSQLPRPP